MLPCPRCKDMVDPEEYRFCPNCGTPLFLPQEPIMQPVVQEESGTESPAPQAQEQQPEPQELQPQVRIPEVPHPVEAAQAPQPSPVVFAQQAVPPVPVQPAAGNPQFTPPQASQYQPPQVPANQQSVFQPQEQPYCAPQGQPPVYTAPPQYPSQRRPGYPQNPPVVYQPVYYYPPEQKKKSGNGAAITGLVFGAASLYMTLMELLALLLDSGGSFALPVLLAIPGEVLGIITVCRKRTKKMLGILALSFAAAAHLVCITANMISRL